MAVKQAKSRPFVLVAETLGSHDLHGISSRAGFQANGALTFDAEVGWIDQPTPAVAIIDGGADEEWAEMLRRRGLLVLVYDEVTSKHLPPRTGR